MKVIFLDIDGVFCTLRSHFAYAKKGGLMCHFDPTCCRLIKKLLELHNAKIVVSSVWRYDHHKVELFAKLKKHNLFQFLHEDWRTSDLFNKIRGEEVKEWLSRHPEVEKYIIIDDDSDFLEEQKPFFIKTNGREGFGAENFQLFEKLMEIKL